MDAVIRRVAAAVAAKESEDVRPLWRARFEEALRSAGFIPSKRILAEAGRDQPATLFSYFAMGTLPDAPEEMFAHLGEAAITLQQGCGVGIDFSTLPPLDQARQWPRGTAGPLAFMECWDAMFRAIAPVGRPPGSMIGCLRADHPDIEAFVEAKRTSHRLPDFDLCVLLPDAFVATLMGDGDWPLVFDGRTHRVIKARALWNNLIRAACETREPQLVFVDRLNDLNSLTHCETVTVATPCGGQALPPYGGCVSGSINLAHLVAAPLSGCAALDETALAGLSRTAVRFLDNVIDISRYPLFDQETEARAKRRVSLAVTGIPEALSLCGAAHGSAEAEALTRGWLGAVRREAYRASAHLAAEKGYFPLYDDSMLEHPNIASLDDETRALIAEHGLRNGSLTSMTTLALEACADRPIAPFVKCG